MKKYIIKFLQLDNKFYFIYSALLTALFAYLTFSVSGMLTSGMYIMMRGDLFETHVPYIVSISRDLLEGNNIFYSFDISMGMNTALSLAYYAVNPFNILFLIFNKVDYNIIVAVIMILKMSIAAACFQIFASKILKLQNFGSVILSICYAFCGFMAAYGSYHIMWIDAFMLLPLMCYLIIDAFDRNNYIFVCICYTYLFVTQFYMGYMVGVFTLLFVIGLFVFNFDKNKLKIDILKIVYWGISVIVAILLSAVVWVPALLFLVKNNPEDATTFINVNVTFMEIINSLFWGQFVNNIGRHSFTYSGIPVLLLIPFYFLNDKISKKERIIAALITLFLVVSYVYMPLYKLLHAFDAPDSFWFRFSFLLSFVLCSLAARELVYISSISFKKVFMYVIGLFLFYCLELRLQALEHNLFQQDSIENLLINIIFILVWVLVLYLLARKIENNQKLVIALSILIIGVEVISNMNIYLYAKSKEDSYYSWVRQCKYALNAIENNEANSNEFYRVVVNNDMIHNSDSLFGYNGITDFGSSENYNLRRAMSNLGFGTTTRMMMGSGYNPIGDMVTNVKYVIQCYGNEEALITDTIDTNKAEVLPTISLYDTTLNLGFMVENDIYNYSFPGRNAFENCNDLLKTMTGIDKDAYVEIARGNIIYDYDNSLVFQVDGEDGYYVSFTDDEGVVNIKVLNDDYNGAFVQFQYEQPLATENDIWYAGGVNTVNGFDSLLTLSSIIEMEYSDSEDAFLLQICKDEKTNFEQYFDDINYYTYLHDVQIEYYDNLCKEQLYIDDYKNGYIKGHISVNSDRRVLYTSIPYDSGWKVLGNNQELKTVPVLDGAFLAIILPDSGDYQIEMNYTVPGLKEGIICSVIGAILLGIYSAILYSKNKKIKSKDSLKEQ